MTSAVEGDRPDPSTPADAHPLDNPVYAALTGPHSHLAETKGQVMRYPRDVAPFYATPGEPTQVDWADLAALAGPGGDVTLTSGAPLEPPAGWEVVMRLGGVQLVDAGIAAAPDPEAVRLGRDDVPEMLDLVARTQPGPFRPDTIALGTYLGVRDGGRLVAMAGERMHPPGWAEISAVCTDEAYRGRGLAGRLVRAVAAGILARGETPFLHAAASNTGAVRLYEALGLRLRREICFQVLRTPPEGDGRA